MLLRLADSQQMTTEAIEFDLRECIDASLQTVAEHAAIKQIELCYSTASSDDMKSKLIGDEFVSLLFRRLHPYTDPSSSVANRFYSTSCKPYLGPIDGTF
jgi:hypothetical protein